MTLLATIGAPGCGCGDIEAEPGLIGIDRALARIALVPPVQGIETLPLCGALGRVLAAGVRAEGMSPPFDNSAMDGYAVASEAFAGKGPWTLAVTDRVPAGGLPSGRIGGLHAARIFTGAPLPEGADAVLMQEAVERVGDTIRVARKPAPGANLRRAGEDMAAGETVLAPGCRIGPRQIAAAAAAGAASLCVRRPIRVALLVTGDEVARGSPSAIRDVNTPMLMAELAVPEVRLVRCAHGADERMALMDRIGDLAATADLVVTTGGISVGDADHVKPAIRGLGGEVAFEGVAIKPGKPVAFGRLGPAYWLGLPGNPLSALVTWQLFGKALLRALSGATSAGAARRNVVTAAGIRRRPGRCELRPARIAGFDGQGREVVVFEEATHSGRVGGLPGVDGLILIPAEADHLPAGALVEFLPFHAC